MNAVRHGRRRRVGAVVAASFCLAAGVTTAALWTASAPPERAAGKNGTAAGNAGPAAGGANRTTGVPASIAPPTTTTDPGALPQTGMFPSTTSPHFESAMAALWQGILSGSAASAGAAFFPESAYLQLKTVGDPAADYTDRLLGEFSADVEAAHALLGPAPSAASLVSVDVPAGYGHWVPPGVCENRDGYYEVANSRVAYRLGGQVRSFGIASLISWRGEWYVVHLGAVLRAGSEGVVDDPEPGPGSAAPSSTC